MQAHIRIPRCSAPPRHSLLRIAAAGLLLALLPPWAWGQQNAAPQAASPPRPAQTLLLGATTSVENSGLLAHLQRRLSADTGLALRAVALGSGAVLQMGRRGDLDLLLTHHPAGEAQFKADGYALWQQPVMYNTFLLAGPQSDPAGIRQAKTAPAALGRIAAAGLPFVSRGDDSGTHQRERLLWQQVNPQPRFASAWYKQAGQGMGATLNIAAALNAYLLVDSATWAAFQRKAALRVLFEHDASLRNIYTLTVIQPQRFPHVKSQAATAVASWLTSAAGKQAISTFRINGHAVFHPF